MKTLVALLGFLGAMAFPQNAYGHEYPKIKLQDVPVPTPGQAFVEIIDGKFLELEYEIDKRAVRFLYSKNGTGVTSNNNLAYSYSRAFGMLIDLNRNGVFDDDELFEIDYGDAGKEDSENKSGEDPAYCPIPHDDSGKKDRI